MAVETKEMNPVTNLGRKKMSICRKLFSLPIRGMPLQLTIFKPKHNKSTIHHASRNKCQTWIRIQPQICNKHPSPRGGNVRGTQHVIKIIESINSIGQTATTQAAIQHESLWQAHQRSVCCLAKYFSLSSGVGTIWTQMTKISSLKTI